MTDPVTEVAIAPLADVPAEAMAALPRLIRLRYLATVNRWTSLDAGAESLHRATSGRLDRSLLHREVLADLGIGDVATVVFRDQHGLWGWADLWRSAADAPFSDRELDRLTSVPHRSPTALRRCLALTFGQPATVPERPGPIVLVLSPDLEVTAQTPHTDGYLRTLLPPDGDRRPIPAGAYNVAAELLAVEAGVDDHPPTSRVRLRDGVWLTFRAARVESRSTGAGRRTSRCRSSRARRPSGSTSSPAPTASRRGRPNCSTCSSPARHQGARRGPVTSPSTPCRTT